MDVSFPTLTGDRRKSGRALVLPLSLVLVISGAVWRMEARVDGKLDTVRYVQDSLNRHGREERKDSLYQRDREDMKRELGTIKCLLRKPAPECPL